MDYDDNDFQSQNLHLAGEGSNRFPPALRSYSIPKFDFDESLPGAVRFDSLVETEVFLGIDNNEENQWIEDFSRGHSGIHFNSGEVESCSISRCNNVWSEATSSESVEMLLKSVGQEEIIPVQTDRKESDACDELGCIIKPMEPSLKQNNGTLARMDDLAASDLQPTSPPVNVLDNVCLVDDVEGLQPQVDTGPLVTQVDASVGKGSDDLSAISVEGCLTVGEGSSIKDGIHDYGNQSEADNVINEALDDRKEKTSPRMHADSTVCSSQNTTVGSDVLNNEVQINNVRQTSDQKIEALETNKGEYKEEQHASSQEFQRFDQVSDDNLVESDVSHLEETISIDKKLSNVERTSCTMAKVDSGLSDSLVIRDPSGINMKLLGTEGNCLSERHDGHDSSGSSMDNKNLVSDAGPSPLSAEENEASKLKLNDSSEGCFGSISSLTFVSSSAKPFSEMHVQGHDSCSTLAQSTESFERNINSEEVDLHKHDHDLSVEEKEGTALCPDNSNMPSDVTLILDRGVQTLSSDGGGAENKLIDSQLQSDDACGKETAVVGNGVSPDAVVDHTEVEMSHRPLVSLAHKERENEAMVSPEASILDLKTSSQLRSGPEPASEYEEGAAGQIVCESADQPLLMPDGCKTKGHGEGQTVVNSKDSQESTEEMRVLPVFNDLSTNKSDAVTLLVKDIDEKESSKVLELTVNNNEMPGSGPLTTEESGQGTNQKDQVENEAVTVSGDTNRQITVPSINQLTVNNNEMHGSEPLIIEESGQGVNQKGQVENEAVTVSGDTNWQIAVPSINQCGGSGAVQDGLATVSPTVIRTTELSLNKKDKEGAKALSEATDNDASKVSSAAGNPKLGDTSRDERSFTFDISPMAEMSQTEPGKTWNPVSTIKSSILSPTVDGSPSTSGLGQLETKVAQELSHGSQKVTDGAIASSGSNSNTERKSRRSSGKATVKASSKRRNPVKETASVRLERGGKMTNVPLSPPGIFQPVQLNEMQCFGHVNSSAVKPLVLAASTSSLPDLNFSASSSAMFQQAFTDLQQMQLRAQIFVYGALIQGTAPDEAYMISAFGGPDGRSMWENAWRSCIERLHGLKSHRVAPEIHLLSDSGSRVPEQATKQSALLSKEISPSIGRVSSKGIPTILNPVVPLSSPLWSLPMPSADALQSSGLPRGPPMDYQRALSPLPSHQTPPARSSVAPNPSWISQAPFCGPWVASPQNSVLDASGHFSVQLPTTETVQVTPVKESSLPDSSGVKHILSGTGLRTGASSGVFTGISLGPDVRKVTEVSEQHSSVPKPRKRKKISVPESSGQNALLPQSHADVGSASTAGSHLSTHLSTSLASTTPVISVSKASTDKFISSLSAISSHIRKGDQNAEGRATATEQTLTKVKEARVQAEDAAAFAASAVSHSQEIWSQLDKQRKSGLQLDIETKLTSAAAAIAATAAIAKAAASAANVASNAALQAKLMADEAVLSSGFNITGQSYSISFSEGTHNLEKATPASILKSDDGTNNSSSILHAAREAARRRVEAASAASKHAENMVAIVKAAELAADTVSQAGKVVAMANHLPSNEIVAAAPECHPKVTHVTSELFSKSNDVRENCNIDGAGQGLDISSRQDSLNKKELHSTNFARSPQKDESCEDDMRLVDVISGSGMTSAKDARVQKSRKASDLTKTVGLVPEPENDLRPSSLQNEHRKAEKTLKENNIKEASHVEVFKNGNDIKSAWFSANVLSVKDGKAYVAYDEITTGKGLEKLKEWVTLSSDGDAPPKIRIARPAAAMPFEGTRKRRRAAMGDHAWSVGDRVDAWIQDSWWEGVITEKSEKDETLLTVHFPAQGKTSLVKAWHLRPSLVWKDGEWIEWSSSREHSHSSHVGEMPQEKRPRLQSPAGEAKGKDKMPKSVDAMESDKPNEPTLLEISADEKLFNIGQSTRDERKPNRLRMTRTGLQREGSRVILGVPKPGKKRKFMEVSKHYVAGCSGKTNEAKVTAKLAKNTMPQVPGTRGWKSTLQDESSEKRAMSKPRVVKSGKLQNVSGRLVPQKDNLSSADVSAAAEVANADNTSKTKHSVSHAEDTLEKRKLMEFQSFSSLDEGAEGPIIFSSLALPSDSLSSKKLSNANAKAERISKGKLAPAGRKLGKIEEDKVFSGDSAKSTSDVVEPRRSNRRIQPTSRLLEGLQSSMMVPKIPPVSHNRTQKIRSGSRGDKHD